MRPLRRPRPTSTPSAARRRGCADIGNRVGCPPAPRSGDAVLRRGRAADRAGGGVRAAARAVRPLQGEHHRPPQAARLARPHARHGRTRARPAVAADLRRAQLAADGRRAGRASPLAIGGRLGIVGGFAGKRVNTAIMRTMDVFYAFPSVLLAVAISGAMGGGIANGMIALSASSSSRDLPRRRDRDRAGPQPRLHRGGARHRRGHASPSCATTCSATCWARCSSMPPRWSASASCSPRACRSSAWACKPPDAGLGPDAVDACASRSTSSR